MATKFQIQMHLPEGSGGEVKSSAGEALLDAAAACARTWTLGQHLQGPDGAALEPSRAVLSELEYGVDAVKLTVSIHNRALQALVPAEAASGIGALWRAKRALDGRALPWKFTASLLLGKLILPAAAFKEALEKAREIFLFQVAANVHVRLLSEMAKAALPAVQAKMVLAALRDKVARESASELADPVGAGDGSDAAIGS